MEIFTYESLVGISIFMVGILMLNKCTSFEHKHHYSSRKMQKLKLYGRREVDTLATLPLNIMGSIMTIMGSSLSIYGLILFFDSVI